MTTRKEAKIITLHEFEAMIKKEIIYTGLVAGVGYVRWEMSIIYFIDDNPQEWYAKPKYKQISNSHCGFDRTKRVYSKNSYALEVVSRGDLKKFDVDAYKSYYGHIEEMEKEMLRFPQDATRVAKPIILADLPRKESNNVNISAGERVWKKFGTATDVAGELGFLSKRVDKYLSVGKTGINIVKNISDGKYIDAIGDAIMAACDFSIGLYLDIGNAIAKSDYMQTQLAREYAIEYKRLERELAIKAKDGSYYSNEAQKMKDRQKWLLKEFKKCMDNLGYRYNNKLTQPQWRQGY